MSWLRSLRRTLAGPSPSDTAVSRRRFFAGTGAVLGGALLAGDAHAAPLDIAPGTVVDAQGRPLGRPAGYGDPLLGEITPFGFNFAPRGWALCQGQLLPIAQNTALFSLLGTIYGGDGRTTFGLPDLRGRIPIHAGRGPGLSDRRLGDMLGTETSTLSAAQVPAHQPTATEVEFRGAGTQAKGVTVGGDLGRTAATATVGGGQPHNNMPPYLTLNYCIALQGVYPSRS